MNTSLSKIESSNAKEKRKKAKKCNLCDYASGNTGNLKQHIKTHSGEKSLKCTLCEYASVNQGGRSCAGARGAPAEKFGLGRKF